MAEARTNGSSSARAVTPGKAKAPARVRQWLEPKGPRPSRKLFGLLPVARVIPQDVHSVLDYVGAASAITAATLAEETSATLTGIVVGSTALTSSALADYRLSVAKVLPIEAHEVLDYVSGLTLVIAPFAFGYWKKDRVASLINVISGASLLLTSMFTDYRAQKGIG